MKKIFNPANYIITVLMFFSLVALGSFFDLEISSFIYKGESNLLCDIVACIGYFPAQLCALAGGVMVLNSDNHKRKLVSFIKGFILFGCMVFAFYYLYDEYFEVYNSYLGIGIAAFVLVIFMVIIFVLTKNYKDKNKLVLFGLFLISISAGSIVANLAFKEIFLRPRMYYISGADAQIGFQKWYSVDRDMIKAIIASGVDDSNFASFPSGHATCSAAMTALWTLAYFVPSCKGKERGLFMVGVIYMLFVCFTRIWCGGHFLSDVVVGMMVSLFTQWVCYEVYLKRTFIKKRK